MFSKILVPLDGSKLSERALPVALDLAGRYGSELILLRTTRLPDLVEDLTGIPVASLAELRRNEEEGIEAYLGDWQSRISGGGVPCLTVSRADGAARGIVAQAEAEEVSLIVMSTHGRRGFERWVQGSVAERVARRAPCPVLLVRAFSTSQDDAATEVSRDAQHPPAIRATMVAHVPDEGAVSGTPTAPGRAVPGPGVAAGVQGRGGAVRAHRVPGSLPGVR